MSDSGSGVNGKYAPRPGSIPGVVVNFGGNDLVVPPLGLRLAREFEKRGTEATTPDDQIALGIDMLLAALQRNYPDLEREALIDLLDASCLREASEVLADQSGMKRVKPGESAPRSP